MHFEDHVLQWDVAGIGKDGYYAKELQHIPKEFTGLTTSAYRKAYLYPALEGKFHHCNDVLTLFAQNSECHVLVD